MKAQILILLFLSTLAYSQNINISQVDSSGVLFSQKVDLYIQATDSSGEPVTGLTIDDFKVSESIDDSYFIDSLKIESFQEGINKVKGINFLLLIDNSGSMYRTIDGKDTEDELFQRITIAKDAIRNFVSNSIDIKDTISLASFNSTYTFHSDDIRSDGLTVLNTITKPGEDANKTELYRSLVEAIKNFSGIKGRKVVIVLSDGKNVPAVEGDLFSYSTTINEYLKDGISIYGINYAGEADDKLVHITSSTGGKMFEALDGTQLDLIYNDIKDQILKEYLITYRATMFPGDRRYVSVKLAETTPVTRVYFSSNVFGKPVHGVTILYVILPLISLFMLFLFWKIKFEKLNKLANLEILQAAPGVTISDNTIALDRNKTVIGGSHSADLTITGEAGGEEDFATIIFDEGTKHFKVVSTETILVNNQVTKDKYLEAGDVINISGTTIVFDDDMMALVKKDKNKK